MTQPALLRPFVSTAAQRLVSAGLILACLSACGGPPGQLADTGLFDDDVKTFTPRFTLWSDGFEKSRFFALPPGTTIDNSDDDAWVFPVGARFWKEFRADGKRVETRYLEKTGDGAWVSASYIWNDDETEASLAPFFGVTAVRGTDHDAPWAPSCTFCHGDAEPPLGFTAVQLARGDDGLGDDLGDDGLGDDADGGVTLASLVAMGALAHEPAPVHLPADPTALAALGVLHANCGSCHSDSGSQSDMPLRLRLRSDDARVEGTSAYRSAVGQRADDAIDGRGVYIRPGDADGSLVVHRMASRGNDAMMPPTGTKVVDDEGLRAVKAFVESLR
jgi:cytochrome c553